MTHVATIVCDPALPVLTGDMLRRASEVLTLKWAQGRRDGLLKVSPPTFSSSLPPRQ